MLLSPTDGGPRLAAIFPGRFPFHSINTTLSIHPFAIHPPSNTPAAIASDRNSRQVVENEDRGLPKVTLRLAHDLIAKPHLQRSRPFFRSRSTENVAVIPATYQGRRQLAGSILATHEPISPASTRHRRGIASVPHDSRRTTGSLSADGGVCLRLVHPSAIHTEQSSPRAASQMVIP